MTNVTEVLRSKYNGKYIAYVQGEKLGEYSTLLKALTKMAKYAKGQNL